MPRPRASLRALLVGGNVGLVAAAVLVVLAAGAGLLRRLADQQAVSQVGLAAESARQIVQHAGRDVAEAAGLLAERPTLARLLASRDTSALDGFLESFRRVDGHSGCAVLLDGALLASAGTVWTERAAAPARPGEYLLLRPGRGQPPGLQASVAVPSNSRAIAVVALALDEAFSASLAEQIGLDARVLDREAALAGPGDARTALRRMALESETEVAEPLRQAGVYLAVVPLRSSSGEIVGVVEAALPAAGIASSQARLVRSLLLLSVVVGGLAALFSVLLGSGLARPLEALTDASARIGGGDLTTPIPRAGPAEIGTLAESMDDMRRRLLDLTAELRRRQVQAEAILAGIVEGVFGVDRERRIRYVNPQAAALLGLEPGEVLGRFCGDVLGPQGPGGVRPCEDHCPIVHARFRGSTRATERLRLGSGVARTVVITSAPPDASEPAAAHAGGGEGGAIQYQVIRDETEVEATRRLRDAVLANISHEFRTPLSAQLASIELLRDRLTELSPEQVGDLLLSLERGALRLTQLVDNLLESVRIESGRDSIRRRPVALDEVVEEAVGLTSPLTSLRGQTIEVDLPWPLPPVVGDGPRLVQVLVNLLANANKFAPERTTIRVGGEVRGAEVVVWVQDQGPGLPPWAGAPHFERFVRSPGEEPEESGMGLGLWIVKSIVERHGGRLEVRSASDAAGAPGGTRMCVVLPAGAEG